MLIFVYCSFVSLYDPPQQFFCCYSAIDKFIVCQEELMCLFDICPVCCERSDRSIVQQEGTFLKIKQVRFCLHSRPF